MAFNQSLLFAIFHYFSYFKLNLKQDLLSSFIFQLTDLVFLFLFFNRLGTLYWLDIFSTVFLSYPISSHCNKPYLILRFRFNVALFKNIYPQEVNFCSNFIPLSLDSLLHAFRLHPPPSCLPKVYTNIRTNDNEFFIAIYCQTVLH